tara:strand:+ start:1353 stop:1574 length:222 start_codon:yes stop_codon:yes gene_type:complete
MLKSYFHNNKFKNENKKIFTQSSKINIKRAVDINILLNRVKSEEKNELKKKIIFFSFTTFALSLFGTFIAIIK